VYDFGSFVRSLLCGITSGIEDIPPFGEANLLYVPVKVHASPILTYTKLPGFRSRKISGRDYANCRCGNAKNNLFWGIFHFI